MAPLAQRGERPAQLDVIVAYLVMPGTDPVPAAFPATALWRFRLASVGVQAVLWATLGIGFGALTERREATP